MCPNPEAQEAAAVRSHPSLPPSSPLLSFRYRLRSNCEFGKEAMGNQALLGKETLNVKWASDDPNPVAQEAVARSNLDAAMLLMQQQGVSLKPAPFDYPERYVLPAPKKARVEGGVEGGGVGGGAYPDTDGQYEGGNEGEREGREEEWRGVFDSRYGAYYYRNVKTGEVTWTKPEGGREGGEEGGAEGEGGDPEAAAAAAAVVDAALAAAAAACAEESGGGEEALGRAPERTCPEVGGKEGEGEEDGEEEGEEGGEENGGEEEETSKEEEVGVPPALEQNDK
jgi:hypothetical protein